MGRSKDPVHQCAGARWGAVSGADRRLDVEALYVDLDRKRRTLRISGREVLRRSGVCGPSIWTRLSRGGAPDVDNLVRLLAWLGTTDLAPYIVADEVVPE